MLPQPKTNIQEILYTLIENGKVSIMDYPYLSGFRTRVSEIVNKHKLGLFDVYITKKNKFGNSYTYIEHHLSHHKKEFAINIYKSMQK